jgi:S-methylmethionine-dependent homocysteine/selenocysteine methylase
MLESGTQLGYSPADLARVNRDEITMLAGLRDRYDLADVVISGMVGPRGDGYQPGEQPTPDEAADYHAPRVQVLAQAGADIVSAYTLTSVGEATGIVRAARAAGVPVAISFTVETDGRLAGGETLAEAIVAVDAAASPEYFQVNCTHPVHLAAALAERVLRDGRPARQCAVELGPRGIRRGGTEGLTGPGGGLG